jgi:hypothetical protein
MRTITIYNKDGTKTVVQRGTPVRSYDADIDKPFHQRVLDGYRDLEASGKLKWDNSVGSKSFVKNLHERALEQES